MEKETLNGNGFPDSNSFLQIASTIIKEHPELEDYYSPEGLSIKLEAYINNHSEIPADKVVDSFVNETLIECEHIPNRNKNFTD